MNLYDIIDIDSIAYFLLRHPFGEEPKKFQEARRTSSVLVVGGSTVIGVRADADLWSIQAGPAIQTQHRVVHSGPP